MSDEERLNEIPYYIGENISIIYIKKSDDYEIKVKYALTGDRVFSLD